MSKNAASVATLGESLEKQSVMSNLTNYDPGIQHEPQWLGLRCRVALDAGHPDLTVDLRTKPNDPGSSITTPRQVDAEGKVGLLVADETLEGTMVSLVLLDASGHVIGKEATTIGGAD